MSDYLAAATADTEVARGFTVPQSQKASPAQEKNSAGGYTFVASPMTRLDRFLFLGTQGGSYYTREADLTRENVNNIINLIKTDGLRVAKRVHEVSTQGLALRQNPGLFVWALITRYGDDDARSFVYSHT